MLMTKEQNRISLFADKEPAVELLPGKTRLADQKWLQTSKFSFNNCLWAKLSKSRQDNFWTEMHYPNQFYNIELVGHIIFGYIQMETSSCYFRLFT